ncbi:MAG TPA: nitrate transport protein, NrtC-like protein [Cyanobacteria bacterium UBA8803]|nr:nitrate transport protein, NrtC-like protein [Cyanobacteria bacterium UBA9273]HBL58834.1 nitrate transport protein, NrtC-like protein [Cyanobacteria bacterium UBA8803]
MERRKFIKHMSLAAGGLAFTACNQGDPFNLKKSDRSSAPSEKPAIDFGSLEKTDLKIGIIPVMDCAPLVIAKEKGFFQRYGLNVSLSKQKDWQGIRDGLLNGSLDAAHALFGMPMLVQLGSMRASMVSLMTLNRNGSSITFSEQIWDADIRPSMEYFQFQEFADAYREYLRSLEKPPAFAIEAATSMDNYNYRYWLSAMGINPDTELKLIELAPSQMTHKLQAGEVEGYGVGEPWNQQAIFEKTGFVACVNRDIWQGHPGKILATMQSWVEKNPTTARALVAAVLEACQFCEAAVNHQVAADSLAHSQYLNINPQVARASLPGTYNYGGFDEKPRVATIPDFYIFEFQATNYLKEPDRANYPWRSHGVWLLTQMIRWNQLNIKEYPKDADEMIDRIYPVDIYEEVAKAMKIPIPSDRMKVEPAEVFIDQRKFDPSQPVEYLNSFDIRAGRPQIFALS